MGIEFSGILHLCYFVQQTIAKMAGQPIQSNEAPRTLLQNVFFWGRVLFSFAILCFSLAVTLVALFDGKTNMWDSVPAGASVAIFFTLLFVIGNLEGSQIAYFAVSKLLKSERGESFFAKKTCEILFKNDNHNLAAFMIGRQLCVVSCMFVIARITAVRMEDGDDNIFGVSDGTQSLFNTGLLGALIVAIVGSVSWRLLASAFPMAFLNNPITYVLLRLCLFLELTGLLHGAWVLAAIHKKIAGFQRDEVYIGTAEERAEGKTPDNRSICSDVGHPIPEWEIGENPIEEWTESHAQPQVSKVLEDVEKGEGTDEEVDAA
jgi:hypothetical protein